MPTDASCTAPRTEAQGKAPYDFSTPVRTGLNWRHVATVALLIVTLPVFAATALACLPLLVFGAAAQHILKICTVLPAAPKAPARLIRAR
jgi:hypothetical protein